MRLCRGFRLEVEDLAADHVAKPRGASERQNERGADRRVGIRLRIGGDVEGIGQKSVADEDGGRFVIGLVGRWPAASQIVVVERRQIVVDKRIAMHHFDGRGGAQHALALNAQEPRRLDHQKRPQSLSAAEARIAHGREEPRRPDRLARQGKGGQQPVQHVLGRVGHGR